MNTILFHRSQLFDDRKLVLDAKSCVHVLGILKSKVGDSVRLGMINGPLGKGAILEIDARAKRIVLEFNPQSESPSASYWSALVALPRPKTLGRKVQNLVELGIKRLYFFDSQHVDKSYWTSEWLSVERLNPYILRGLEQTNDTKWPQIRYFPDFNRLLRYERPIHFSGIPMVVFDPSGARSNDNLKQKAVGVLGPERGFTQTELGEFKSVGAQIESLGPRVLSSEMALTQAFRLAF